jgi:hypothetical protein
MDISDLNCKQCTSLIRPYKDALSAAESCNKTCKSATVGALSVALTGSMGKRRRRVSGKRRYGKAACSNPGENSGPGSDMRACAAARN